MAVVTATSMTDVTPLTRLRLTQGWYVQLRGDKFDLEDWEYSLNEPFDPVVMQEPDGSFLLRAASSMTHAQPRKSGKRQSGW